MTAWVDRLRAAGFAVEESETRFDLAEVVEVHTWAKAEELFGGGSSLVSMAVARPFRVVLGEVRVDSDAFHEAIVTAEGKLGVLIDKMLFLPPGTEARLLEWPGAFCEGSD